MLGCLLGMTCIATLCPYVMGWQAFPFILVGLSVVSESITTLPDAKVLRNIKVSGDQYSGNNDKNNDKWPPHMISHTYYPLTILNEVYTVYSEFSYVKWY
jgi:hypothetical protein